MLNYSKKNAERVKIILALLSTLFIITVTSCGDNTYIEDTTAVQLTQEDFLVSLQQGLQKRWDAVDSDTNLDKTFDEQVIHYANLVNIEYTCLSKYLYCEFEDPVFQLDVKEYLNLLQNQIAITKSSEQDENSFNTKWHEYYLQRTELIKKFYEKYGLSIDKKYNSILLNEFNIDAYKDEIPLSTIKLLKGEWEKDSYKYDIVVFNDQLVSFVDYYDDKKTKVSKISSYTLSYDENSNIVLRNEYLSSIYTVSIVSDDQISITYNIDNSSETYSKVSDNTTFPEPMKDPYIGMSRSELENSTWGTPKRINKTTTEYEVSEQWVYERYTKTVYIYLTNGYVTTIQE